MEKLYRISEAASIISTNPFYLYRLIKAGKLTATKIGRRGIRLTASQIDRYLEAQNPSPETSNKSTGTKG